jgi:hypothetical protein
VEGRAQGMVSEVLQIHSDARHEPYGRCCFPGALCAELGLLGVCRCAVCMIGMVG